MKRGLDSSEILNLGHSIWNGRSFSKWAIFFEMAILESKVIFDHFKASVGFPSLKIIFNGHPGHRM